MPEGKEVASKAMRDSKELRAALLAKIKELQWDYVEDDDGSLDIRQFSPAGEDFWFYIAGKSIAAEVREYYEGFDPEEHAAMWIEQARNSPNRGYHSIPDIRTLIDDADRIDDMLRELATALDEVEDGWRDTKDAEEDCDDNA